MLSREPDDSEGVRRLNLTRLVLLYNRKFEASEPTQAVHYISFLRDLKDRQGESIFSVCMSSLVITTQEFDLLLGRLEPDGRRNKEQEEQHRQVPRGRVLGDRVRGGRVREARPP